MRFPHRLPLLLVLLLPACLESEERITVRADGSVHVELQAKGDVEDLADGYPLPLAEPWTAQNEETLEWLASVGPDTGSPRTRANALALPKEGNDPISRKAGKTLCVAADFARVADLPHGFAPATEPYADAYQQRSARLAIEQKGSRRVYVFERTLASRPFGRFDTWTRMRHELGDELSEKLEHGSTAELDEADRAVVIAAAETSLRAVAQDLGEDALTSVYLDGDAALPVAGRERCVVALTEAIARVAARERIASIVTGLLQRNDPRRGDEEDAARFTALEREVRETLRGTLASALEHEAVPRATRNAVLGQLEWLLTASDQTNDLGDESFTLRVRMPGTVVGGNFLRRDGDEVIWELPGIDLRDKEQVLRVVSVVE